MQDSATRPGRAALSLLLLLAFGCASTTELSPVEVDLQIEQLPDDGFAVEKQGAVSIAYQMSVRNRSLDAITLRKVEMQVLGSGPYTLRKVPAELNETIEPGQERVITFTMWSDPVEQRSMARKTIWVSGTAYYDSAKGSLRKEFTQSFREP